MMLNTDEGYPMLDVARVAEGRDWDGGVGTLSLHSGLALESVGRLAFRASARRARRSKIRGVVVDFLADLWSRARSS